MDTREVSKAGDALFKLDGKPTARQAFPLALQHVVAMVVGCVTPAIIIGGIAQRKGEISQADITVLVQSALLIAGISTLIQLISFKYTIGSGLPVIIGVSFAYLASLQGIAEQFDLATLFGAQLAGSLAAILVGIFIKRLRFLFPPMVTGTVVFVIGITLYPTAINYMAGGSGSKDYGSWQNWTIALVTLAIVTILNHFGKGAVKLSSILLGILAGYGMAMFLGMIDFMPVQQAEWFHLAKRFILESDLSLLLLLRWLFSISSIPYRPSEILLPPRKAALAGSLRAENCQEAS